MTPSPLPDWPARMAAPVAAAYLGISQTKFLGRVKAGGYPVGELDGCNRLWHRKDLDDWLENRRPGGAELNPFDAALEADDVGETLAR